MTGMRRSLVPTMLVGVLGLGSIGPQPAVAASHQEAIEAAGLAALYAEDAQVLPPGMDAVSGRAAITALWQSFIDAGFTGVKLEVVEVHEVHGMGEMAGEVGRYELTDADGAVADRGKYIVLWKKVGGEWKLYRDIWNSSMPVGGEAPAAD